MLTTAIADYLLAHADEVIILDNGQVVEQGTYQYILERSPEITAELQEHASVSDIADSKVDDFEHRSELPSSSGPDTTTHQDVDWSRQRGTWSVYQYYFHRAGYVSLFIFLIFAIIYSFSSVFSSMSIPRIPNLSNMLILLCSTMATVVGGRE